MDWHAFAIAIGAVLAALFLWDLFVAALLGQSPT